MVTVYILQSERTGRYYAGQTQDLARRIIEHNSGENASTRGGAPWKIVYSESCLDRTQAVRLEGQIKKRGIGRYLQAVVQKL